MIEAAAYAIGMVAGGLVTLILLKRPRRIKNPCPWEPCGYPLPKNPLIVKQQTRTHYATYAVENCQGCDGAVQYNDVSEKYERIATTNVKI